MNKCGKHDSFISPKLNVTQKHVKINNNSDFIDIWFIFHSHKKINRFLYKKTNYS